MEEDSVLRDVPGTGSVPMIDMGVGQNGEDVAPVAFDFPSTWPHNDIVLFKTRTRTPGSLTHTCTVDHCDCDPEEVMQGVQRLCGLIMDLARCRSKMCPRTIHHVLKDEQFGVFCTWLEMGNKSNSGTSPKLSYQSPPRTRTRPTETTNPGHSSLYSPVTEESENSSEGNENPASSRSTAEDEETGSALLWLNKAIFEAVEMEDTPESGEVISEENENAMQVPQNDVEDLSLVSLQDAAELQQQGRRTNSNNAEVTNSTPTDLDPSASSLPPKESQRQRVPSATQKEVPELEGDAGVTMATTPRQSSLSKRLSIENTCSPSVPKIIKTISLNSELEKLCDDDLRNVITRKRNEMIGSAKETSSMEMPQAKTTCTEKTVPGTELQGAVTPTSEVNQKSLDSARESDLASSESNPSAEKQTSIDTPMYSQNRHRENTGSRKESNENENTAKKVVETKRQSEKRSHKEDNRRKKSVEIEDGEIEDEDEGRSRTSSSKSDKSMSVTSEKYRKISKENHEVARTSRRTSGAAPRRIKEARAAKLEAASRISELSTASTVSCDSEFSSGSPIKKNGSASSTSSSELVRPKVGKKRRMIVSSDSESENLDDSRKRGRCQDNVNAEKCSDERNTHSNTIETQANESNTDKADTSTRQEPNGSNAAATDKSLPLESGSGHDIMAIMKKNQNLKNSLPLALSGLPGYGIKVDIDDDLCSLAESDIPLSARLNKRKAERERSKAKQPADLNFKKPNSTDQEKRKRNHEGVSKPSTSAASCDDDDDCLFIEEIAASASNVPSKPKLVQNPSKKSNHDPNLNEEKSRKELRKSMSMPNPITRNESSSSTEKRSADYQHQSNLPGIVNPKNNNDGPTPAKARSVSTSGAAATRLLPPPLPPILLSAANGAAVPSDTALFSSVSKTLFAKNKDKEADKMEKDKGRPPSTPMQTSGSRLSDGNVRAGVAGVGIDKEKVAGEKNVQGTATKPPPGHVMKRISPTKSNNFDPRMTAQKPVQKPVQKVTKDIAESLVFKPPQPLDPKPTATNTFGNTVGERQTESVPETRGNQAEKRIPELRNNTSNRISSPVIDKSKNERTVPPVRPDLGTERNVAPRFGGENITRPNPNTAKSTGARMEGGEIRMQVTPPVRVVGNVSNSSYMDRNRLANDTPEFRKRPEPTIRSNGDRSSVEREEQNSQRRNPSRSEREIPEEFTYVGQNSDERRSRYDRDYRDDNSRRETQDGRRSSRGSVDSNGRDDRERDPNLQVPSDPRLRNRSQNQQRQSTDPHPQGDWRRGDLVINQESPDFCVDSPITGRSNNFTDNRDRSESRDRHDMSQNQHYFPGRGRGNHNRGGMRGGHNQRGGGRGGKHHHNNDYRNPNNPNNRGRGGNRGRHNFNPRWRPYNKNRKNNNYKNKRPPQRYEYNEPRSPPSE